MAENDCRWAWGNSNALLNEAFLVIIDFPLVVYFPSAVLDKQVLVMWIQARITNSTFKSLRNRSSKDLWHPHVLRFEQFESGSIAIDPFHSRT